MRVKQEQVAPMSDEDQEYLRQLFLANYGNLMKYAQKIGKGLSSEDLVQETFLIASTKISSVRSSDNPAGWLMRTLQNQLKKALCKDTPLSLDEENSGYVEPHEQTFEGFTLLSETCQKYLSQEDWELLYKKSQGYTSKELAQEYNLRESACRMRLLRVRALLRTKLESPLPAQKGGARNGKQESSTVRSHDNKQVGAYSAKKSL